MPFRSSQLNRQELRHSVIRLWRHRKQQVDGPRAQARAIASQCRHDVAVMLGFASWSTLIEDFDRTEQRKAKLAAKDLYPNEPLRVFTPVQAEQFMRWLSKKGAIDMYIAVDKTIHFYWPGETGASHDATRRHLEREDVLTFMVALGLEKSMLASLLGHLAFRTNFPGPDGTMLCWLVDAFVGKEHVSLHLTTRDDSIPTHAFPALASFTPDTGLVLLTSPHTNHLANDVEGLTLTHPLMQRAQSFVYKASDGDSWYRQRQPGRFTNRLAHKNVYTQSAMNALERLPHLVDVRRCIDGDTLAHASRSALERPVYVGLCGDMYQSDPRFERVSTSLVSALHMFNPQRWKLEAAQLFDALTVVYCRVRPISFREPVAESLVFDEDLRERCRQALEAALQPDDLLTFFAKEVLLQGNTFLKSAELKPVSPTMMHVLQSVEQAWSAPIKAHLLTEALTHPGHPSTTRQRL